MKTQTISLDDIVIQPITNSTEFEAASQVIDQLVDADLWPAGPQRERALDLLEAITVLAIAYEQKHYVLPKPKPLDAIRQRMEQLNLSQRDVAPYFGGENRVSEVLNGRRSLTLKMIKALHQHLGIPAETLLSV